MSPGHVQLDSDIQYSVTGGDCEMVGGVQAAFATCVEFASVLVN